MEDVQIPALSKATYRNEKNESLVTRVKWIANIRQEKEDGGK